MTTALARHAALPNIARATLPESYERACTALAACERIDECKDWADKAAALASYAKQADDETLHRHATRISARAIRRCGELLRTFENQGARTDLQLGAGTGTRLTQREAAAGAGMSKRQEVTAVRVANVPAEDFNAMVDSDTPPTVTALAEMGKTLKPAPPGFKEATHAIGTVKEFAAFCREHSAAFVAGGIQSYEVQKVREHIDVIALWLATFVDCLSAKERE